jgi:hypothetical protein
MQTFRLAATERSPEIVFDFAADHLAIRGESYPEDVTAFYRPVFDALDRYLAGLGRRHCRCDIELIYCNSSSVKILMIVLDKLEQAARQGADIEVHWAYDEEDDTMEELGRELGEDLQSMRFHLDKRAEA